MLRSIILAVLSAVVLSVVCASSAVAYRPALATAYPASDNRAWYECVNVIYPYDPWSQRCLTAGTLQDTYYRHTCQSEPGGRDGGAWCFTFAYATNNSRKVWRLRIKVTENCATCYGYHSRTYSREPYN